MCVNLIEGDSISVHMRGGKGREGGRRVGGGERVGGEERVGEGEGGKLHNFHIHRNLIHVRYIIFPDPFYCCITSPSRLFRFRKKSIEAHFGFHLNVQ